MPVQIIMVPYRYEERAEGLGAGPLALLDAKLAERLAKAGVVVAGTSEAELPPEQQEAGRRAINIGRLGASTAGLIAEAHEVGSSALILCGDDTAAIGVLAGLQGAYGAGASVGLIWFDAHGDFNTPETSFSGILAGMPVAILAGLAGPQWRGAAGLSAPISTDRIVIAGVRELDEKEETLLRSTDARLITTNEVRTGTLLNQAVQRLAASTARLWIHVDLDILDPRLVPSASTPAEEGLEIDELSQAMIAVLETGKVAAISVAGLNPGAGARGERSRKTTMTLLEKVVPSWADAK